MGVPFSYQLDRCKFTSADSGTGSSVVVAARYSNAFFTPAQAGAVDGRKYTYVIQRGNDIEIQQSQVYTASTTSFARGTPFLSVIGGTVGTTQITLDTTQVISVGTSAENVLFDQTRGDDIAAAATIDLNATTGKLFTLTGNTGISTVTLDDGQERVALVTGTPTITVGSNLIGNGGGSNVTLAAGDMLVFRGFASGVVRFSVMRASGKTVVGPDALPGYMLKNVTRYTSSQTYTPTAGTRAIYVVAVGGGGGGGGAASVDFSNGGGGGSGRAAYAFTASVAATYAISIGAAGAAGSNGGGGGGSGGATTFGSLLSVGGGAGGAGDEGGVTFHLQAGGAAGSLTTGTDLGGNPGSSGIRAAGANDGNGGPGGSSLFGVGGAAQASMAAGNNASGRGAGGGGGSSRVSSGGALGGAGAAGACDVYEYF